MNDATAADTGLGHNILAGLRKGAELDDHLTLTHLELTKRAEDLIAAESRMPEIDSPEADSKATEFVKQIQACVKALDAAREGEKEPYDTEASRVHAFFRGPMDKLTAPTKNAPPGVKERVQSAQTRYKLKIAEEERHIREAEAAKARAEEDKRRAEALRAQQAADEAARAAARKRNVEEREKADRAAALAKARADEAAAAERVAAEARAAADKSASANLADLSRARGGHGGVSSLKTEWTFRDLDRATLDLEKLRQHIPLAGLEQAVRDFVKSGGREIRGAVIFEEASTRGA